MNELIQSWLDFWTDVIQNESQNFHSFEGFVHKYEPSQNELDELKNLNLKVVLDKKEQSGE